MFIQCVSGRVMVQRINRIVSCVRLRINIYKISVLEIRCYHVLYVHGWSWFMFTNQILCLDKVPECEIIKRKVHSSSIGL